MAPSRIVFIRHAEQHGAPGVTAAGQADAHSLTVRGWQRAGALARMFAPFVGRSDLTPDTIFASRIAEGSETRRPQETVAPLIALLPQATYNTTFAKVEIDALMADVLTCAGKVLVAWEHSMLPECVGRLPEPPSVPDEWPSLRYDLLWIVDRIPSGWAFAQRPQHLLDGDS